MEYESARWTGEKREVPSLLSLIDKYVPTHTQSEVTAMAMRYEARVHDLLLTIHQLHEQMGKMTERMVGMEKEYYSKVKLPVSLGSFGVGVHVNPAEFNSRTVTVEWRPDPYRAAIRIADTPFVNEKDTHFLFEMVGRQFEEAATRELIPALRREYVAIYNSFKH